MLQGYRWTLDSCSYHVHCTDIDETKLDLLPLQRQPEDVRSTLGVSDIYAISPWVTVRYRKNK